MKKTTDNNNENMGFFEAEKADKESKALKAIEPAAARAAEQLEELRGHGLALDHIPVWIADIENKARKAYNKLSTQTLEKYACSETNKAAARLNKAENRHKECQAAFRELTDREVRKHLRTLAPVREYWRALEGWLAMREHCELDGSLMSKDGDIFKLGGFAFRLEKINGKVRAVKAD